jgi:hypothetical protein
MLLMKWSSFYPDYTVAYSGNQKLPQVNMTFCVLIIGFFLKSHIWSRCEHVIRKILIHKPRVIIDYNVIKRISLSFLDESKNLACFRRLINFLTSNLLASSKNWFQQFMSAMSAKVILAQNDHKKRFSSIIQITLGILSHCARSEGLELFAHPRYSLKLSA